MFVGCYIDSDSYTDLGLAKCASSDEIIAELKSLYPECSIRTEQKDKAFNVTLEDGEYFVICDIFEIPDESTSLVVNWHAYNGVDFDIKVVDSIDDGKKYIKQESENFKASNDIVDFDTYKDSVIIDDGNEWHLWLVTNV